MTDPLELARAGDEPAFAALVAPYRRELTVLGYRMLGSMADAEDALQETLLAAWRGLASFEQRSSLRTWLYRIATHVCLRMAERRPRRVLSYDVGPARDPLGDLGTPLTDVSWVEPWIEPADDPADRSVRREGIGLAYVAALQHLPVNQRAVLILRDVLSFSAAETAGLLDTSVASVTSALQRARTTLAARVPEPTRPSGGLDAGQRRAVDAFVSAFERGDVPALVALLAEDVRFTMPPLPAWFAGVADVSSFLQHRSLVLPWRITARRQANGRPALLGHQRHEDGWRPGALMVLHVTADRIDWIASFLDPGTLSRAER